MHRGTIVMDLQQPKYLIFQLECRYWRQTQCLEGDDLWDTF